MALESHSLFISQTAVATNLGSIGGQIVWFIVPGVGRFVISTNPHDGYPFAKVGEIRGNTISFQFNEVQYRLESIVPVLSDRTAAEVWLMVEAIDQPKECLKSVSCFGAASPFEYDMKNRRATGGKASPVAVLLHKPGLDQAAAMQWSPISMDPNVRQDTDDVKLANSA